MVTDIPQRPSDSVGWELPAITRKATGEPRRVGVEFEFQGVAVHELAGVVATTLRGESRQVSDAEYEVAVPGQGDYRVEIDFALLKKMASDKSDADETSAAEDLAVDLMAAASSLFVPCEVVAPPLPMTDLAAPMEALTRAIREAGGQGTRQSPVYAFGVHLNVEPPDLSPATVSAYLKAFVCLYDWIVWAGEVDLSRRITPFIDRFPKEYEALVTRPDYAPDWRNLIADYLALNPTRNRALDMLPMFATVNEEAVSAAVEDDLVKARPAFHYRLANCCIDEPHWSIAAPWERWLKIEHLANDTDLLQSCCAAFQADRERLISNIDNRWRDEVQAWLPDHSSA